MNEVKIFSNAIRIEDSQERNAYLGKECGEDLELRQRLERLIKDHFSPNSMLPQPGESESTLLSPAEQETSEWDNSSFVGRQIGPYKLLQKIGEGGMGVVFMAEQIKPVKRRVALKLVKPGMDSKRVLARFEAERQALALMDHPNIAKVLDAGTTTGGLPFFVMELVKGLPITEFCDQHQLGPKQRLSLFIEVCRGIQHAHQKGIIHRDLKPSNILVTEYDEQPVAKIIDFGIAKALSTQLTEKTLFTEFGQIVGTLEYMSPEQANHHQLDIDTRSDVYSLGIVLYVLLTGETPFSSNDLRKVAWDEYLRIIREVEPKRPSVKLTDSQKLNQVASDRRMQPNRLRSFVRGDLDWIVMKALRKERSKRYATANELADELTRYLSQQPVNARPPSSMDRLQKLCKRHPTGFALACLSGVILVVAALVWQGVQQRRAELRSVAQENLNDAMQGAALALGKALSTPAGQKMDWGQVETNRQRILDLLESRTLSDKDQQQAELLLQRVADAQKDRELGDLIEEALLAGATQTNLESWQKMESRFKDLFRRNGMDLDQTPPRQIAEIIRQSPRSSRWTDALELWIGGKGHMQAFPGGPRVTAEELKQWAEAMYLADADPLRTVIRKQIYSRQLSASAIDEVADATDLSEQSSRTLAWLATAYMACGEPEKSNRVFEIALEKFPQDVMLNYDWALTLTGQDRNQEAIRILNRCIALRPDIPGFWISMAKLLEAEGESEAAARAIKTAKVISEKTAEEPNSLQENF
ncbi:MAG: serine/threonine-protein kinase [Planctomycetota bacterium]